MNYVDQAVSEHPQTQDTPNLRVIHTSFGKTIRLERRNPHGFVYVVWYAGATPEALSGAYSEWSKAREAVALYLANNTFQEVTETPVAPVEPPKYKKQYRKEA